MKTWELISGSAEKQAAYPGAARGEQPFDVVLRVLLVGGQQNTSPPIIWSGIVEHTKHPRRRVLVAGQRQIQGVNRKSVGAGEPAVRIAKNVTTPVHGHLPHGDGVPD